MPIRPDRLSLALPPIDLSAGYTAMSETDIISRCLADDPRAWGELIDRYSGLVYAIARRSGLREDEADDIAQVVFATLARRLGSVRDIEALPKWVITTTQRECWRRLKQRQREETQTETTPAALDADHVHVLQRQQLVRESMRELGGRCQKLLTLLYLANAGLTYQQIAERLDIAVGSIGPLRQRCLARLSRIVVSTERECKKTGAD